VTSIVEVAVGTAHNARCVVGPWRPAKRRESTLKAAARPIGDFVSQGLEGLSHLDLVPELLQLKSLLEKVPGLCSPSLQEPSHLSKLPLLPDTVLSAVEKLVAGAERVAQHAEGGRNGPGRTVRSVPTKSSEVESGLTSLRSSAPT